MQPSRDASLNWTGRSSPRGDTRRKIERPSLGCCMNNAQPTKTAHESPDIDEDAWTIYVFIILASCAVLWMHLPFSQRNRGTWSPQFSSENITGANLAVVKVKMKYSRRDRCPECNARQLRSSRPRNLERLVYPVIKILRCQSCLKRSWRLRFIQ